MALRFQRLDFAQESPLATSLAADGAGAKPQCRRPLRRQTRTGPPVP